jgi:hypothetical protein
MKVYIDACYIFILFSQLLPPRYLHQISGWQDCLTALLAPSPPLRWHMPWFLTERSLSKKSTNLMFYIAAFGCVVHYKCGSLSTGCWLLFARSKCEATAFQIELLTHLRARHRERVLMRLSPVSGYNMSKIGTKSLALLNYDILNDWGTRWCSWLRHCATSRKVASSITDSVTGIFHWHNPSGRTMALGLTLPLTEIEYLGVLCMLICVLYTLICVLCLLICILCLLICFLCVLICVLCVLICVVCVLICVLCVLICFMCVNLCFMCANLFFMCVNLCFMC